MILYLANSIIGIVHSFLLSEFFCKIFKLRYSKYKSLLLCCVSVYILAAFMNYVPITIYKIILSTSGIIVILLVLSSERFWLKFIKAFFGFSIFILLDLICSYLILPIFHLKVNFDLGMSSNLILARTIFSILMYIFMIVLEMIFNREKSFLFQLISVLFFIFGFAELIILRSVCLSNQEGLRANFIILTVICSASIMLQYFVSMDIFHHVMLKNQRDAEIEQMKQERNYQYEYYLSAYQQSEQLRDMRHDMRNYLQTIQFLMEEDMDSNHAKQMIDELLAKIGDNFNKN